jgi:hypothetical protein
VLAAAPKVENRVPDGADWDGTDDTGTDAESARQLLLEREPGTTPGTMPTAAPTTAQAPAPRAPGT